MQKHFNSLFLTATQILLLWASLRPSLVKCGDGGSASKLISALLSAKAAASSSKLLGVGLLQGNRRLLLVLQEEAGSSSTSSNTTSTLHSAILDLVEISPEGPLVVSAKSASVQSLPSNGSSPASPASSALGGLILQDAASGAFGWAQFVEREGEEGGGGKLSLDWYRHSKAGGVLEKISCAYASAWMRDYIRSMALFSSNVTGAFSWLLASQSELLPGAYSVTTPTVLSPEKEASGPTVSISTSYSPRRIDTSGERASLEGGFILGRHELLYGLDNAHRKVFLYRLNQADQTSFKSDLVPAAAELPFESLIRFTEEGEAKENSSGGNWLYLVVPALVLALVAFIAYVCASTSAKNLALVKGLGVSVLKSSPVGHTGAGIKKTGGGSEKAGVAGGSGSNPAFNKKSSTMDVSATPLTDTIDSSQPSLSASFSPTATTSKKRSPKRQQQPKLKLKLFKEDASAVSRPVGSIFGSSA